MRKSVEEDSNRIKRKQPAAAAAAAPSQASASAVEEEEMLRAKRAAPPPSQHAFSSSSGDDDEQDDASSAEERFDFARITSQRTALPVVPPLLSSPKQQQQHERRSSSAGVYSTGRQGEDLSRLLSNHRPHRQSFPVINPRRRSVSGSSISERRDSQLSNTGRFSHSNSLLLLQEQDTGSETGEEEGDGGGMRRSCSAHLHEEDEGEEEEDHLPVPICFTDQIHQGNVSSLLQHQQQLRRNSPAILPLTTPASAVPPVLAPSAMLRKNVLGSIRERRHVQKRVNQDACRRRDSSSQEAEENSTGEDEAEEDEVRSLPRSVSSSENSHPSTTHVIRLQRGGVLVKTSLGFVQFGIPPETIKDVLELGLEVPRHYVVPKERFDNLAGLNMCELEFPGYYQFFLKQRSMTVIVPNEDTEHALRRLMDEILRGPPEQHLYAAEECMADFDARPNHVKEMAFFVRPREGRTIEVDSLFTFQRFEAQSCQLSDEVTLLETEREWVVMDHGREIARIEFWLASMVVPQVSPSPLAYHLPEKNFIPPKLGITVLGSSHGFDAKQRTSGFVLWMHGKGIMVDPPPFCTGDILKRAGISPRWISAIILTHCHADHDAGTFQKILVEGRVTLMTTKTIMASFLRKYSKISGYNEAFLCRLFEPKIVRIGEDVFHAGGRIRFHYSFHALPCVGFQAFVGNKSIAYSADTLYEPKMLQELHEEGVLSAGRLASLLAFPFETADVVIHEAGIPPIHTPVDVLKQLSANAQSRLYLIHIAELAAEKSGLRLARVGAEHTIRVVEEERGHSLSFILDVLTHSELFFPHLASANRFGRALVSAAQERTYSYESPQFSDYAFLDHAKSSHVFYSNSNSRPGSANSSILLPAPSMLLPLQQRLSNLSQSSRQQQHFHGTSVAAAVAAAAAAVAGMQAPLPQHQQHQQHNHASHINLRRKYNSVAFAEGDADDDFTVPQVADLLRMSNTRIRAAGEVVSAKQGEGDVGLYLILRGFCQVRRNAEEEGAKQVPPHMAQPCEGPAGAMLEPGDCFGILNVEAPDFANHLLRTSEVVTLTEVELLELDLTSLSYMLNMYPALERRLTRMHELRLLAAWRTMELNSCLRRLVSFQRTQLLSILQAKEFRAGEELWSRAPGPRNAYLVIEGEVCFPEMGEGDLPFTAGAFLCDFHSMIERRRTSSSSAASSSPFGIGNRLGSVDDAAAMAMAADEERSSVMSDHSHLSADLPAAAAGSPNNTMSVNPSLVARTNCMVFQIAWRDAFVFLESNPGVLVQVFHSCVTE